MTYCFVAEGILSFPSSQLMLFFFMRYFRRRTNRDSRHEFTDYEFTFTNGKILLLFFFPGMFTGRKYVNRIVG